MNEPPSYRAPLARWALYNWALWSFDLALLMVLAVWVFGSDEALMACGNVTLLAGTLTGEKAALPKRLRSLLRRMLAISQMRGAQAGGGALLVERRGTATHLVKKRLNGKREDLATGMTQALGRAARFQRAHDKTVLVQTHVRYATAGRASLEETHPHSFMAGGKGQLRRVTRHEPGREPVVETRWVQTTLTHNGDLDALRFRGVTIPFPDLGAFLEHLLCTKNYWTGDSPQLSGCIELFFTKGMWLESLRLAYQQVVASRPPDFGALPIDLRGPARDRALRDLLNAHPRAEATDASRWAKLAEQAFLAVTKSGPSEPTKRELRQLLATALSERLATDPATSLAEANLAAFAQAAVTAFFDNDLYIALRKLEPCLEGTFGCVVTSTLEPSGLIAFSRGQPLSLGFRRQSALVCVVSERAAIKILDDHSTPAFDERLDLDLCAGEIARVRLDQSGVVQLTLYGVREGREWNAKELIARGRLVSLIDNPYVSSLPKESSDRLAADIADTPEILRRVSEAFSRVRSQNHSTAEAFARALFSRPTPRVLLLGITNELWIAEQFAQNLKTLFPSAEVSAISSNGILAERPKVDANTVVLAVSQTGQDFPTLGALVLSMVGHQVPSDAFFVLTGEIDTLMGQAVGQSFAKDAPFSERIFTNQCGFRSSEAQFSTISATHLALCELCLHLAKSALDLGDGRAPLGFALSSAEFSALVRRRDAALGQNIPALLAEKNGRVKWSASPMHGRLAQRFRWHVLEGIVAFAFAVLILELNLRWQAGILPSTLGHALLRLLSVPSQVAVPLTAALGQADVLFYAFLTPFFVWLLRLVQGRPLLHRQGPRELLIGDGPTNHRILWLFCRKLFGLSYGFASIKPYSANCQDELIMTHEPARGSLALIGLVDFRHEHLKTRAQAALMTAKQLGNSRSFAGSGAEIVTVGHTPPPGLDVGFHVALPCGHGRVEGELAQKLSEGMFDSWERLLGMQLFLERMAHGIAALFRYDRSKTKDQVYAPTTASPVSAASIYQLLSRSEERYEKAILEELPFEVAPTSWRGAGPRLKTTIWQDDAS